MDHVRVIFNTITKTVKMCDVVIRVKFFFLIRRSYFDKKMFRNNYCVKQQPMHRCTLCNSERHYYRQCSLHKYPREKFESYIIRLRVHNLLEEGHVSSETTRWNTKTRN